MAFSTGQLGYLYIIIFQKKDELIMKLEQYVQQFYWPTDLSLGLNNLNLSSMDCFCIGWAANGVLIELILLNKTTDDENEEFYSNK